MTGGNELYVGEMDEQVDVAELPHRHVEWNS